MQTIQANLKDIIAQAAKITVDQVNLEHPELEEHGDYSTNIALVMKGGRKLAEELALKIKGDMIAKTEVAGPGFINIWLKNEYLVEGLGQVSKFQAGNLMGKKIMVEFTDPNPFKEFHIGHLYSNVIGEVVSRLIESQGAEVWRVCYQGDVGLHVAKSIWGMQFLSSQTPAESASLSEKANFLGQAYSLGASKYEEEETVKKEINELNKKIYEQDQSVAHLYEQGKRWSLEYFDMVYQRLGTKFKKHYFESEAASVGLKIVRENMDKGIFKESNGAVVFPGEDYGLHTRVFINSLGLATYEAKELGLAPTKYADFPYDQSIIITGNEINDYFKVLLKALSLINPDLATKTKHLSHGMVRLPSGKMSSRTGKIITGEWLMDEAKKHAASLTQSSGRIQWDVVASKHPEGVKQHGLWNQNAPVPSQMEVSQQIEFISEKVGIAAIKYALLKSGIGRDVEFDFEESVSFDGNSGPYLQYTYARTQSILRKVDSSEFMVHGSPTTNYELNDNELKILRYLYRYTEVVEQAAMRYSPNLVANFLYELAQRFNTFYNKDTILGNELRLKLTTQVGEVLKSGLQLLGIEALERM